MKEFKVSKLTLAFNYLVMAAFILVVLIMSPIIFAGEHDSAGKVFFFVWSIFMAFLVYKNLRMPHSIMLSSDSLKLVFKSILSKKEIESMKIGEIEVTAISNAFITFKYDAGKLTLLNGIDGLHELITEIKKLNPNLKTKGC